MKIDGKKIKVIRKQKGMSRAELSTQSGVSIRTLEDWEAGRRNPRDFNIIESVLKVLNIKVDEIYSDEYISVLNTTALINSDEIQNETSDEIELIQKIENIFNAHGINGILRVLDKFIYYTGSTKALKILEEYENESC